MKIDSGSYTLLLNGEERERFLSFYKDFASPSPTPYIDLFVRGDTVCVSLFKKGKDGLSKALFQGEDAYKEARVWDPSLQKRGVLRPMPNPRPAFEAKSRFPQIGSDEVGTGDFFGPIEVAAAFVRKEDLSEIEELGITDSKKMKDETILSLGPTLIKRFPYSHLSLGNEKYNEVAKSSNMNAIKAKMHNACLLALRNKFPEAFIYQDQFAPKDLYYSYLAKEKEVCEGICFHIKGESLYPSVALASVIARYSFLRKMAKMGEKYGLLFPFGAGSQVDQFAKEFVRAYGLDELKKVAKTNFKNYSRLIDKDGDDPKLL